MKMEINGNIINIYGNIKSIEDFEQLKSTIDGIKNSYNSVTLNLIDSIAVTSSVIGYLTKLAREGIKVNINVNDDLYTLFKDLELTSIFNVRKV